jgi:hypothetical protein
MQKKIIILILLLSNLIYSQNEEQKIDSLISEFTSELKKNGTNEFFYVKEYCNGGLNLVFPPDCLSIYETYLFWRTNNKSWIKKFDTCKNYKPIELSDNSLVDFFIKNSGKLKNEIVKKYTITEAKENSTIMETNPTCFKIFQFQTENDSFINKFDLFDLTTDSDDKNLYYDSNNKLKLVELGKMCDSLISTIEKGRQFEQ